MPRCGTPLPLQQMLTAVPDGLAWAQQHAWEALKSIIKGYRRGPGMGIFVDAEGLLHAGDAHTQLTWMDAQVRTASQSLPATAARLKSTPCGTTPLPLPTALPPLFTNLCSRASASACSPARCVFAPFLDKRRGRASG